MPRRSPFTTVPGRLAALFRPRRADLHIHTIASDGEFTPSQVVFLARLAGLCAVAITDHDTLAAVEQAQNAASGQIEVVPAVEITAGFLGRELHLLGYFVRTDEPELNSALARLCERRRERFLDFMNKLTAAGMPLPADRIQHVAERSVSLGRRHVAGLLVATGFARTRNDAFSRLLGPLAAQVLPKLLMPIEEAIRLVRVAGGVASLAHPPAELSEDDYRTLARFGLNAVEAEYPWGRRSQGAQLRELAARLGLAVSGGSDCHGPEPTHRRIGSNGITFDELADLRERCVGASTQGC